MSDTRDKRFQPWLPPSRAPHEPVVRKMLTEALRIVLIFIMKNHLYTFDNEIRLQSEGGPIGLQLTGAWHNFLWYGGTESWKTSW